MLMVISGIFLSLLLRSLPAASLPGFTPQSIILKMDARVKPAHDS
jgi:hypothetical protein